MTDNDYAKFQCELMRAITKEGTVPYDALEFEFDNPMYPVETKLHLTVTYDQARLVIRKEIYKPFDAASGSEYLAFDKTTVGGGPESRDALIRHHNYQKEMFELYAGVISFLREAFPLNKG